MDDDIKGGNDKSDEATYPGEELDLGLDITPLQIAEKKHANTQIYLKMMCERELGVTFMNWKIFVRFCRTAPEGKAYTLTLDEEDRESIISAEAFIQEMEEIGWWLY